MSENIELPSSSYEELVKIIKAYSHQTEPASLTDIANLITINNTTVSGNNKFLIESGLITSGNKKAKTELGGKLGRALDHDREADIRSCWREVVSANKEIAKLVTTVRIQGGMTEEYLATQVLYVSGQRKTSQNRTGANTVVEILKVSGLLVLDDGKLVVSQPSNDEAENPVEDNIIPQPEAKASDQVNQFTVQSPPQIAINIQLHLPETKEPEVYQNLFKALKENLLT